MNEQQSNRNVMKTRFAVVLASVGGAALLLPGCAVGPNYKRPAIHSPANFRNAPADAPTNTLADVQWWELYKDETLNSLIRTALTNPITHNAKLDDQVMPPEVPVGLPSALLERRPDIRQAEQSLRSANAQVGVSVEEFFPKIGLTTFMGKVSPELSAFTAGSANAWSAAASLSGPIFQGGALMGQKPRAQGRRLCSGLPVWQRAL